MKKKLITTGIVLSLIITIMGCGRRPDPAGPQTQDVTTTEPKSEVSISAGVSSASQTQQVSENGTISSDNKIPVGKANDNNSIAETSVSDYDTNFDVHNTYQVSDALVGKKLSDGAFIQIGNAVLQLGKSTLRDFVNAGVDLYNTKAKYGDYYGRTNRDQEINAQYIKELTAKYQSDGSVIRTAYLSGDLRIDLSCTGKHLTEEDPSDPIVDFVMIEAYAGNTGNPDDFLYGGPSYFDCNSVYIVGGTNFTGPISAVPNDFGNLDINEQGESNGRSTWTKVFTADASGYTNYCQLLSGDDHVSSIVMKVK